MKDENKFSQINVEKIKKLNELKIDYSKVRKLEYTDKEGLKPETFKDFITAYPRAPIQIQEIPRPSFPADLKYLQNYSTIYYPKGKMVIAVNWDLYPSIKASLERYVMDLANDGYYATIYQIKNGTPQEFRSFLSSKYPILGALLVGNVPVPWFEMDDDYDPVKKTNTLHAEFPCDLYYMDLNGTWTDADADGKFSGHPSNVQPEIWISRLWTPTSAGNDAVLINNYFDRNHRYRKGLMGNSRTALAYVDDDWKNFGDCAFDLQLPAASIEVITDPEATDADRYKTEVNQHRGWAQICAHSSPNGHSFKIQGGKNSEWVPNTYLRDINPPNAFFYNLFACSNARFTEQDYMAGWYLFDKPDSSESNGMGVVGSTKTGSMLIFENFYGPMGKGKVLGDAYKDWWNALGPDHDLGERQWYYGMALLGDPTLNWWSGATPILKDPGNGDTFDQWPRKTNFRWDPIEIPGVTYTLEIDAFGAVSSGKWAAEVGKNGIVYSGLTSTSFEHEFVGAQRGRWRVKAKIGNIDGIWSDWNYFKYTV